MKLSDLAGVFSRYFVVGFFVPAFFGLAALSVLMTSTMLPDAFQAYSAANRLVIIGAVAVPIGMLLQGFLPALLNGLTQHRTGADFSRFVPARLYALMLKPETSEFRRLKRLSVTNRRSPGDALFQLRTTMTAISKLDQRYPPNEDDVLPTRLGNTLLATQEYAFTHWGLDTWPMWSRLESFFSDQEQQSLTDAKTEVAFFVNSSIAGYLVGILLVVDEVWHTPLTGVAVVAYAVPFVVGYFMYRLSVGAAIRWCERQRAAVDLHRIDLFKKLGYDLPKTVRGQYLLARALNRFVLYRPADAPPPTVVDEPLIGFAVSDTCELQPRTDVDALVITTEEWVPATSADRVWLETDCVLYGAAFATLSGHRVDPRSVVVDASGIARWCDQG